MLPDREDLVQLVDIDRLVFHEETLISPDEQIARFAYNPETIHVLKDTKTNLVVGGVTISPLKHDVLEKLIKLEIDETQVKKEDGRGIKSNSPLAVHNSQRKKHPRYQYTLGVFLSLFPCEWDRQVHCRIQNTFLSSPFYFTPNV